jgi:hypothetical protein
VAVSGVAERSSAWWLTVLERRRARVESETLELSEPICWTDEVERQAAIRFFNAAFRAEESGLRQAHELAEEVRALDPTLAEVLRLYGDEEGWHRELLTEFLAYIGGEVRPMGRVTRTLYRLYGRAERMETIVLTNLMFETIGSTTYRMALANVEHAQARQMLTILTRDEAFHVPLNVHFLSRVLEGTSRLSRLRLRALHQLLFVSLLLLPLASRPKAYAFDRVRTLDLMRGYARAMGGLFVGRPELGFSPPGWLLALLGVDRGSLRDDALISVSVEAAERSANREDVKVQSLSS